MSRRCSRRGSSTGHAQHLVVAAGLVGHAEHADGAAADEAAGERRLLDEHERVERVVVLAEGVLDEAVVGGVLRRREQGPVEPEPPRLVVELVLVAAAPGHLDEDVEIHALLLSGHRSCGHTVWRARRRTATPPRAGRSRPFRGGRRRTARPNRSPRSAASGRPAGSRAAAPGPARYSSSGPITTISAPVDRTSASSSARPRNAARGRRDHGCQHDDPVVARGEGHVGQRRHPAVHVLAVVDGDHGPDPGDGAAGRHGVVEIDPAVRVEDDDLPAVRVDRRDPQRDPGPLVHREPCGDRPSATGCVGGSDPAGELADAAPGPDRVVRARRVGHPLEQPLQIEGAEHLGGGRRVLRFPGCVECPAGAPVRGGGDHRAHDRSGRGADDEGRGVERRRERTTGGAQPVQDTDLPGDAGHAAPGEDECGRPRPGGAEFGTRGAVASCHVRNASGAVGLRPA